MYKCVDWFLFKLLGCTTAPVQQFNSTYSSILTIGGWVISFLEQMPCNNIWNISNFGSSNSMWYMIWNKPWSGYLFSVIVILFSPVSLPIYVHYLFSNFRYCFPFLVSSRSFAINMTRNELFMNIRELWLTAYDCLRLMQDQNSLCLSLGWASKSRINW